MIIKKLDIYILKKFFVTIFFAMLINVFIYVIIDLFDHLSKFLDAKTPLIGYLILYTLQIPLIISLIFPAVIFMSLLFTLGNLAKYQEIIAMKTAGISIYRISVPIIIFGIILSISHFYFNEKILPVASRELVKQQEVYLKKKRKTKRRKNEIVYQGDEKLIYIKHFITKSNTGRDVSIQQIEDDKVIFRIDAKSMKYTGDKWLLRDIIKRDFSKDSLHYSRLDSLSLKLNIKPKDITAVKIKAVEMGYAQLGEYIKKNRSLGLDTTKWEVERLSKLSDSAITIVMILIAIPFSTGRVRSSSSVAFGVSVLFAFVYYLVMIMFKTWGMEGGMDMYLASWGPNIIFFFIAIYLFATAKS